MKAMIYILYGLLIIIGVFSLGYYCLLLPYIDVTFTKFWLVLGSICSLCILGLYYGQRQQWHIPSWIQYGGMLFIIIGFATFLWLEGRIIQEGRPKPYEPSDYVIVLGARVRGTIPSLALYQRLEVALDYLNTYPKAKAILSGGQGEGEDITEAEAMKRYLMEQGIEEERIIKEEVSENTYENITLSLALIKDMSENIRINIITSNFHVYRAKCLAMKEGIRFVQGIGAPVHPRLTINFYVREFFAVLKDGLFGNM